ncbi:MAG: DNA-binding protein [Desulfobulbaceae bacterium]|nr:DNA-binding protein [Desulfobulbaceae bacterium]
MIKFRILICAAALLMLVYVPGCKANNDQAAAPESEPAVVVPSGGQQAAPEQMKQQEQPAIQGKVLETMDAAGYTYVNVETDSGPLWAAMPQSDVEVGQDIALTGGMEMQNFEAKSLGRVFDSIIFSGGIASTAGETAALPPGHESFADAMQGEASMETVQPMVSSGGSQAAIAASEEVNVEKADGENAYTIGEIFANKGDLDKQTVRVRGKIVKVSMGIMGKNWIHLQDGTGDAAAKTHDLVVTTMAEPEKGSVVVVEGTLSADRDFGSGYRYDAIIEEAVVQ